MHLLPSAPVPTPVDDALAQSEIKTPFLDHLHPSDRLRKSPKHRNKTAPSLAGFSHTGRDGKKKAVVARRKSRWEHTRRLLSTYAEPEWSAFAMMPKALLIPCARCSPSRLLPRCWHYQHMLNSAEATVAGLPWATGKALQCVGSKSTDATLLPTMRNRNATRAQLARTTSSNAVPIKSEPMITAS